MHYGAEHVRTTISRFNLALRYCRVFEKSGDSVDGLFRRKLRRHGQGRSRLTGAGRLPCACYRRVFAASDKLFETGLFALKSIANCVMPSLLFRRPLQSADDTLDAGLSTRRFVCFALAHRLLPRFLGSGTS